MAKITTFIIIIIAFILILATGFTSLMSDISSNYGITDYNSSRMDAYNKLNEISNTTEDIKNKASNLSSKSGVLDVLGGFFESAYDGLKVSAQSFSFFDSLKDQAIEDSNVPNAEILKTGITLIVIIVIFLGIIIGTAIKRDI
jgi:hypothetical protein